MTSEKFANRPAAEVAVAYTASDTTLEVDDASDFPAEGVFRVLLGNTDGTIFRVDSVAGDVFTGAAEAFDGNASIGATVQIVASRAVAERFLQAPDTGQIQAPSGISAADLYGPLYRLIPMDQSGWTDVNSPTAPVQAGGLVGFSIANVSGEQMRARVVASPSTPYTFTTLMIPTMMLGDQSCLIGMAVRESATQKILVFGITAKMQGTAPFGTVIRIRRMTNPTTFASEPVLTTARMPGPPVFLEFRDNGTNTRFRFSFDGVLWETALDEARGTFFTTAPDQVGIGGWNNNSGVTQTASFLGWNQS